MTCRVVIEQFEREKWVKINLNKVIGIFNEIVVGGKFRIAVDGVVVYEFGGREI